MPVIGSLLSPHLVLVSSSTPQSLWLPSDTDSATLSLDQMDLALHAASRVTARGTTRSIVLGKGKGLQGTMP